MKYACIAKCGRSANNLPETTPLGVLWKPEWGFLCGPCAHESIRTASGRLPKAEMVAEPEIDDNAADAYNELLGADDK